MAIKLMLAITKSWTHTLSDLGVHPLNLLNSGVFGPFSDKLNMLMANKDLEIL